MRGFIVSFIVIIVCCTEGFQNEKNAFGILSIAMSSISIFLGIIGWKIGNKFVELFAPNAIFYSHTSDLIKTKLFWKIGPQTIASFILSAAPIVLAAYLFGVQIPL